MKKKALVVGIAGTIRAGKDSVKEALIKILRQNGLSVFSPTFSDILARILEPLGVQPTRKHLSILAQSLQTEKEGTLAYMMSGNVEKVIYDYNIIILNGVRWSQDLELLRRFLPRAVLIGINAPVEDRWKRATANPEKRDEAEKTLEEFTEWEKTSPNEEFVPGLLARAKQEGCLFSNPGITEESKTGIVTIAEEVWEKIRRVV